MPTLGDSVSSAIAARARALTADAVAPEPGIARRLSARGRGRGVGAVVAAASLVSAGAWWQGADGAVTPQPDPSPSVGTTATVTLALDDASWSPSGFQPSLGCGDTVPEPNVSERGFTLNVEASSTPSGSAPGPTLTTSMTYEGEEMEDASVGIFDTYVVKDGIVVGYLWAYDTDFRSPVVGVSPSDRFEGHRFTLGNWNTAQFSPCTDEDFEPGLVLLEAGTYEVVVVEPVRHSAESLAFIDLDRSDYVVGDPEWGLWEQGSIDCREAIRQDIEFGGGYVPVQCDPLGAEGVGAVVDAEAGTLTLDYKVRLGPLDLDIVLASEPIPWTLEEDLTVEDIGWTPSETPGVTLENLTCEDELDSWGWPGIAGSTAATTAAELTAPGGVPVALDPRLATKIDEGTLTIGEPTEAWLVWFSGGGFVLLGTADAEFSPSGSLPFDRSEDYLRPTVTFTSYQACPGTEGAAAIDDEWVTAVIAVPVVIDGTGGERDVAHYISIDLGTER